MEFILENGIASKLLGTYYIVYIKNTKTIQITKKNTKILERNTKKKTMKPKEIIIKHVFSYIFGWSAVIGGGRR